MKQKVARFFGVTACVSLLLAVVISLVGAPQTVVAQTTEFSNDPQEFVSQMNDIFSISADKKKAKAFIDELKQFMATPIANEDRKQHIINDCNLLKKRKARPFPDYHALISTMMQINGADSRIAGSNYNVWHEVLGEKLRTKNVTLQKIQNYLNATTAYLESGAVARSNSALWKTDAQNVVFRNEGVKLYIDIPKSRLVCAAQGDSVEILETEGVVDFDERKWTGESGRVTWQRCGLDPTKTYATFGEYSLDMTKSYFNIDSVCFMNTEYFPYPLYGRVEHKVIQSKSTLGKTYPKFFTKSDERREVKGIFKDIDYEGGFAQIGQRFQGSGSPDNPAVLTVYREDTLFIAARAVSFALYPDRIESNNTQVYVILNDGEIRHPGLRFRYTDRNREITMLRGDEGAEKSKYYDTYHMVTFDVEQIKWRLGEKEMHLGMVDGASRGLALFESIDYYRQEDYNEIQGMALSHPFQSIKDFARYNGGDEFTAEAYAGFIGATVSEVRMMMIQFSFDSFVEYNEDTDIIKPTQRLYNYLDNRLAEAEAVDPRKQANPSLRNPRLADVDYDVMVFESLTTEYDQKSRGLQPNGIIDLRNYDIKLNGVVGISISDFQNVAFYPDSGRVFLKKNRDFEFNGKIEAGMVTLRGDNFYFSYDNFNIDLKRISAMNMTVISNELDQYGQRMKVPVENTICDLTGTLQIDFPNNKSGLRGKKPRFPELSSTKEAYVYFDAEDIQDGQYKRDKFYYTVDPFVFTDINNIRYSNTRFEGVLTSNIFPEIRQELVIRREDNSLGFQTNAPEEGYPIYEGRATYYAGIDLSNAGLHGAGDIEYQKSLSSSADFTFLPDLTLGETYNFTVTKSPNAMTTFPGVQIGKEQSTTDERTGRVRSGSTELEFFPFSDKLNVYNTVGKFRMFPNEKVDGGYDCILDGGLSVTPSGLRGLGEAQLPHGAKIEAGIMDFTDHTVIADTTYFAQYMVNQDGLQELVSDGLRRDLIKNERDWYNREYSPTKATMVEKAYETNDALTENEVFYKLFEKNHNMERYVGNRCMVAMLDFDERIGKFSYKNIAGGEKHYNTIKFRTRVKEFTWDMERNEQTIGMHGAQPGLRFVCTKNEKETDDSLAFYVPYAIYNATSNVMHCEEVKYVNCADATIHLADDGLLTIRSTQNKNTIRIDPLEKSTIDLKTDSTYHQIYNAKSFINGAVDYRAIGDYDFVNKERVKYTIFMDSITTAKENYRDEDGRRQTRFVSNAIGHISDEIKFDKYFAFKGEARIRCGRQLLEWDGGARMIHNAKNGPTGYSYFTSIINPEKVRIPVGDKLLVYKYDPKQRHQIFKDFFIRKDSVHVYSSYAEVRKDASDISIVNAKGYLYHNDLFERFDITLPEKIAKSDTIGSLMSFIPSENAIAGFGQLKLGISEMMGQKRPFDITTAGNIRDDRNRNVQTMDVLMNIDFMFHDELATLLYNKIKQSQAPSCDSVYDKFSQRLYELYDTASVKAIFRERSSGLDPKTNLLSASFGELFTFDKVAMTWLTQEKAYVCDTTVNLMMMRSRSVNKKVRIKAEFIAQKTGPRVCMQISAGDDFWIYLYYKRGWLQILSSDSEFNSALQTIPASDRSSKSQGIRYTLSPESNRKRFLTNFVSKTVLLAEMQFDNDEEAGESEEAVNTPVDEEAVE